MMRERRNEIIVHGGHIQHIAVINIRSLALRSSFRGAFQGSVIDGRLLLIGVSPDLAKVGLFCEDHNL